MCPCLWERKGWRVSETGELCCLSNTQYFVSYLLACKYNFLYLMPRPNVHLDCSTYKNTKLECGKLFKLYSRLPQYNPAWRNSGCSLTEMWHPALEVSYCLNQREQTCFHSLSLKYLSSWMIQIQLLTTVWIYFR